MIEEYHINWLFNDLWPDIEYSGGYLDKCLKMIHNIDFQFARCGSNYDDLLDNLAKLPNIGLTIASGLIHSVFPEEAVPFDAHTMCHALNLRILNSEKISGGKYIEACKKIADYCHSHSMSILDFVREAYDQYDQGQLKLCKPR